MSFASLPGIRGLIRIYQKTVGVFNTYIPPGHYYSPVISKNEILHDKARIFRDVTTINGIDLNENLQLELLNQFAPIHRQNPFLSDNSRFDYNNGFYSYSDGIFLYCFLRHFEPRKIIEIGSGYSSQFMSIVNDMFFQNNIKLTFIEPYPQDRLNKLVKDNAANVTILAQRVQEVNAGIYSDLEENDILFIDSSHVSKTGSDVNFLLFEVLPKLKSGVLVHIHDIFFPFEYPEKWVLGERFFSWNEPYILRAFLTNNNDFEIVFWNSYIAKAHEARMKADFPEYFKKGSASIWLRKKGSN